MARFVLKSDEGSEDVDVVGTKIGLEERGSHLGRRPGFLSRFEEGSTKIYELPKQVEEPSFAPVDVERCAELESRLGHRQPGDRVSVKRRMAGDDLRLDLLADGSKGLLDLEDRTVIDHRADHQGRQHEFEDVAIRLLGETRRVPRVVQNRRDLNRGDGPPGIDDS